MKKIGVICKGIIIWFIIFIVISKNGKSPVPFELLVGLSILLTVLFLDGTKNKVAIAGVTVFLTFICWNGFVSAIICFGIAGSALGAYYIVGCRKDGEKFLKDIFRVFEAIPKENSKMNKNELKDDDIWKAWNIFHPIEERYAYDCKSKILLVKRKFPKWNLGDIEKIPISEFENVRQNLVQKHLIWCTVAIPLKKPRQMKKKTGFANLFKINESPQELTEIVLCNIRIKRWNELEKILNDPVKHKW